MGEMTAIRDAYGAALKELSLIHISEPTRH
mgnify:CR=1 FL=1